MRNCFSQTILTKALRRPAGLEGRRKWCLFSISTFFVKLEFTISCLSDNQASPILFKCLTWRPRGENLHNTHCLQVHWLPRHLRARVPETAQCRGEDGYSSAPCGAPQTQLGKAILPQQASSPAEVHAKFPWALMGMIFSSPGEA